MNPPRIFKYAVPVDDDDHDVVLRGQILHVASQEPREVQVWAVHDDDAEPVTHTLRVVGTGQYLPDGAEHIGTAVYDPFVWHVVRLPRQG